MTRNIILSLAILAVTLYVAIYLLNKPATQTESHDEHEDTAEADYPRGPHNGRLLEQDGFAVEITIFETGVPPEFRVYPYYQQQPLDPSSVGLTIELGRTGNMIDQFEFSAQDDLLRGNAVVIEPHSFDVMVSADYQGKSYQWRYESYEGRTTIANALAAEAGIVTETAGPVTIIEQLPLTGRVETNPGHVSQVRARFPGIVKEVHTSLGAMVKAGEPLLTVQSNESLRDYTVNAPIGGLVIKRNVHPGETTSEEPLFTIADLSKVWVQLDVFATDVNNIRAGQSASIETLDGYSVTGIIDWLEPLASHASQSFHARVTLDNPDGGLRPGQFVRAKVDVAEHEVSLAVKRSAIQKFRDFDVVFARFGETYEVRMLELGNGNEQWVEVTDGLLPGTEYVTENSYLIKADIEKAGAAHDH